MNSSGSVAKIEAKVKQKEAKRVKLRELEELKLNDFIDDSDLFEINKEIDILKKELNLEQLKPLENFNSFFDEIDLNPEELKNIKTEYIVDSFIAKNDITTLVASQNAGKSTLAISIASHYLTESLNARVVYLDYDNSKETQAERGIGQLKEKFGKKLRYLGEAKATPQKMNEAMVKLSKSKLDNTLIIIDNIKNLIVGDRDKNKDVSKAMNKLKRLRSNGATIIALHHTNKPGQDGDLIFAGSSAFLEDTANAYLIRRNDFKQAFTLEILKNRTGKIEKNIAFRFSNKHELIKIDFAEASETQEIVEINEVVIEFIEKQSQKPSYSQIMQHLQKAGYSRNKANQALQNGKGRYWQEEKLTQNNKSVYSLIPQKPNVVEFEYLAADNNLQRTEQIVKNTCTSDTSPILGVSDTCTTSIQVCTGENMNIDIPVL